MYFKSIEKIDSEGIGIQRWFIEILCGCVLRSHLTLDEFIPAIASRFVGFWKSLIETFSI